MSGEARKPSPYMGHRPYIEVCSPPRGDSALAHGPVVGVSPIEIQEHRSVSGDRDRSLERGLDGTSYDEPLGGGLVLESGFALGGRNAPQSGYLQTVCDVIEAVPEAGERQCRFLGVRPMHRLAVSRLEGDQKETVGVENSPNFGEGIAETLGRGVDDRVPTDDASERRVEQRKSVESAFFKSDSWMSTPGRAEHDR